MKGISNIIAVILILMITVALAAMSYVWFTSVFKAVTEGASEATAGAQAALATQFSIEAAKNLTTNSILVTIRNIGSQDINIADFAAYVDDVKHDIADAAGVIKYKKTATFNVTNVDNPCGRILKITAGTGYTHTTTVIC